jgi:membrane fusion protein, macrolide-specific efflux system
MKKIIPWIREHKILTAVLASVFIIIVLVVRAKIRFNNEFIFSEPLKQGTIKEAVYGIGTVTASQSFQLKSGVTTTIRRLYVKEGDIVKKGAPLVDLEGTSLFTAPFDGTITSVPFKERETVFAQSIVIILTNLKDRYILVSLEQQGALRVKSRQKAVINLDTIREHSFEGDVQSIYSNGIDFYVRIATSQLPDYILPGMTADIAIVIKEKDNVVLIPVAAIGKDGVLVQHDGKGIPKKVQVKIGLVDGAVAEVLEGDIKEGDRIVTRRKTEQ